MNIIDTCRRGISIVVLLALLPSCVSYHNVTPPELNSGSQRDYRLTMLDETRVLLTGAVIYSDTIRGFTSPGQGQTRQQQAIPLSQVRVIEVRQFNKGKAATWGTLAAAALVIGGLASLDAALKN